MKEIVIDSFAGGCKHALVSAFLAKHFGGHETPGTPLSKPIDTVTAKDHHALVSAFLTKFRGDCGGVSIETPMPTITSGAGSVRPAGAPHAMALTTANLVHLNHGEKQWSDVREPLRTVTSAGNHAALVYAFLIKYFGTAIGANLLEPSPTATGKDRFGLVTVTIAGALYVIVDIGMRMLTPRELARAQGFPDTYLLTGTKSNQVARIGNSVCPVMAKVLCEANYKKQPARRRRTVQT